VRTERPKSRAKREREAKAYWDSLTPEQEVWALRKMGYFKIGERRQKLPAWPGSIGIEPAYHSVRSRPLASRRAL
jgi:hypothetical protein